MTILPHRDFLVEIGTEELPPKSLLALSNAFTDAIVQGLLEAQLSHGDVHSYVTPRRLAVRIEQLVSQQPDRDIEKRGPALTAAFDAKGNPTQAALSFAKANHVEISALQRLETEKGSWLVCRYQQNGQTATSLMPKIIEKALTQLPIAKRMRWGDGDEEFVRPVQWIVLMYGTTPIPATLFGHTATRNTYGHRFLHPTAIALPNASDYDHILKQIGFVMPNFNERREAVRHQSTPLGRMVAGEVVLDPDLLDEVTGLVEWPVVLLANFDPEFLKVPKEALIAVMRDHQRTFPIVDSDGELLPHFIVISNIKSKHPEMVIQGNERVMRARFSDAAFFYNTDSTQTLADYLEPLKQVVFQNQLGSLYDKAQRIAALAGTIAQLLHLDVAAAQRAGLLAKADLMTQMVGEFPELQGTMGYYYAKNSQEGHDVAKAIGEHYQPRFAGDVLPHSALGCCVALADKIDTLVGIFGINQAPTGDKDPFGLRRATVGILRIIIENQLPLDIEQLLTASNALYQNSLKDKVFTNKDVVAQAFDFMIERLRAWYGDQGISADIFAAVNAKRPTKPYDFSQRIAAVQTFRQLPEATALAAANKRVSNILKQGVNNIPTTVNTNLLMEPEEKALALALATEQELVQPMFARGDYTAALTKLANLRLPVDHFFNKVLVMADDEKLRQNRLALLTQLRALFFEVADISLLQS